MSIFGFSTEPSAGGDFLPIVKYDSRAGRIFRMDRIQDASGNYTTEPVDITSYFKAMIDLENVETGWINFTPGAAPSFSMITMKQLKDGVPFPARPSVKHKNGVRFMIKLAKDAAQGQPAIREMAGTAKSMLNGIEALYMMYEKEKDANPGKLPAIVLEKTTPVTTGTSIKSTNYHPTFKVVGWAPRGDLVHTPKGQTAAPATNGNAQQSQPQPSAGAGNGAAPSTGAQRAVPPQQPAPTLADDFG